MARRGGKSAGGSNPNTNSSSSTYTGSRWQRSRPSSVNDGDLANQKKAATDSTRSSPIVSSQNSCGASPMGPKKSSGSSGKSGRNSALRSRGSARNSSSTDPKFSISNEDFPALPGARANSVTSNKGKPAAKENKKDDSRPTSANSLGETGSCQSTDDSGVSSSSRGNTPLRDQEATESKKPQKAEKRKTPSPTKDVVASPRNSTNKSPKLFGSPYGSPKKKMSNNQNFPPSSSFIKLSKSGQKIPERRGGGPVKSSKFQESMSDEKKEEISPKKFVEIKDDVNNEAKQLEEKPTERVKTPLPRKIISFSNGDTVNIPGNMLDDQFGMIGILPVLKQMQRSRVKTNNGESEPLTAEQMQDKIMTEHAEMLAIGVDLNVLGVPTKTSEHVPVYESFAGPFGMYPLAPSSIALNANHLPSAYYTAKTLQGYIDMNGGLPDKLGVHEIFYIFYNFPKEIWQWNAARELQHRGWRYNIKEKLWIRKKLGEPDEYGITSLTDHVSNLFKTSDANTMIGIFEVYDQDKARITSREMRLNRSDFEVPIWEQKNPDTMQRLLVANVPQDCLWGPRSNDGKQAAAPANPARVFSKAPGTNPMKSGGRRLLSFADTPDYTTNSLEHHLPNLFEDSQRQQMYSNFMSKLQHQTSQHLNYPPAARHNAANSTYHNL